MHVTTEVQGICSVRALVVDIDHHSRLQKFPPVIESPSNRMSHLSANTKPKRRRTPRQLERKRALDKASQKFKRERQKASDQQLQEDLRGARAEIARLNDVIEFLQKGSQPAGVDDVDTYSSSKGYDELGQRECCQSPVLTRPSLWLSPSSNYLLPPIREHHLDLPELPRLSLLNPISENLKSRANDEDHLQGPVSTAKWKDRRIERTSPCRSPQSAGENQFGNEDPSNSQSTKRSIVQTAYEQGSMHAVLSAKAESEVPSGLDCCCKPRKHQSYSDCFEQTVFNGMMETQGSHMATPTIPTTPEIADLLLIRDSSNPVSKVLHKMLKRKNMDDLIIRSAVYVVLYRVLRVSALKLSSILRRRQVVTDLSIVSFHHWKRTTMSQNGIARLRCKSTRRTLSTSTLYSFLDCEMPWYRD